MKCIDCQEEMSPKEEKRAWLCMECDGPMHVECAMEDSHDRDLCEHCYYRCLKAEVIMRKAEA